MEVFEGTVRLADEADGLRAVLLVAGDRLTVTAQEQEIGNWRLAEISARLLEDECHVSVEGEELIVSVPEPLRFAEAIGPSLSNPGDGRLREFGRTPKVRRRAGRMAGRLSPAGRVIAAGLAVTASLALWAPAVLVGLVLLGALASLLVGGFALLDPFTAVRIPDPGTPALLIRSGIAGLVVALGLAVLI